MNEQQEPINQTQFSFEEPIFENTAVYADETQKDARQDAPKSKKKLLIFGLVGCIILVLLIVGLFALRGRNNTSQETTEEAVTIPTQELGPLQQRIQDARDLLNASDPTKQDLSFPPVDLNIRLDPKERR